MRITWFFAASAIPLVVSALHGDGSTSPSVVGVTNAASFAKDSDGNGSPVAPGSLVSIFGTYPGATLATATTLPLPFSLGGVGVTFNDIPAPLSAVAPTAGLIVVQVPVEVLSGGQTSATAMVVVTVNGVASAPQAVPIIPAAPGVFTVPPTGQGNAILIFLDPADKILKIAAPASAKASIGYPTAPIPLGQAGFFYATGLGATTPPVPDGTVDTTVTADDTPIVLVGGVPARVQFAGQAPEFPGVNQINIVIPNGAPMGDAVSLQVQTAGGKIISTPGATISIVPSAPLSITTSSLVCIVGIACSDTFATLVGRGGTTPYSWSATGLPNGLSLNPSTGVLSGTPTATGIFSLSVTLTDSSNPQQTVTKTVTLTIGRIEPV